MGTSHPRLCRHQNFIFKFGVSSVLTVLCGSKETHEKPLNTHYLNEQLPQRKNYQYWFLNNWPYHIPTYNKRYNSLVVIMIIYSYHILKLGHDNIVTIIVTVFNSSISYDSV